MDSDSDLVTRCNGNWIEERIRVMDPSRLLDELGGLISAVRMLKSNSSTVAGSDGWYVL